MRKICVVVTARASYSRVKSVLAAICAHPELQLQLIVTASALVDNYGSIIREVKKDGFEITAHISTLMDTSQRGAAAKTTGLGIIELASIFENIQPHIVVTIADRFETMATAVAASYLNIPLAHIQGGEVTGNIDEKVRHAVTKLSDMHFVATAAAQQRVIRMGESPKSVFFTGCPSMDIVFQSKDCKQSDFDLYETYGGAGSRPDLAQPFLIVLQHPETSYPVEAFSQTQVIANSVLSIGLPVLWFWPNADQGTTELAKGIRIFRETNQNLPFHFFKNLNSNDFINLLRSCACLVGNSSVGLREGAGIGIPVVNIGTRQMGRERGRNVLDVDYSQEAITQATRSQLKHGHYPPELLYGQGNSGSKIADILATYPLTFEKKITY